MISDVDDWLAWKHEQTLDKKKSAPRKRKKRILTPWIAALKKALDRKWKVDKFSHLL